MTQILSEEQKQRALEVMEEYLGAPKNPDGRTPRELHAERDKTRYELIANVLKPLLANYLEGRVALADFKSQVDSINKRNACWGFRGIKGQMFFNLLVNVADDESELDQEIKAAIVVPGNEDIASSRIKTFSSYVKRIGESFVESGGSPHGKPKVSSVPYFLSYFWQIQDTSVWPVYYTNSVQVMNDLNLWSPSDNLADNYITYKRIHDELCGVFSHASGEKFGLYEVEHVFWFKGGNPFGGDKPLERDELKREVRLEQPAGETVADLTRLPESFIPPIIAILPRLARNDETLTEAAKASGTSIPRALEKSVDAAFTILGYETKLLGQGQGRVPDGLALDIDNSYAILWDSKARGDKYSMGTDDRTIREYIVTQSRELRRRKGLRNVYYIILSSQFSDDYDDPIRSLKMETDISEVILMEADALVAMVDTKLRASLEVALGPDGLQRLYTVSSVLTAEAVREMIA